MTRCLLSGPISKISQYVNHRPRFPTPKFYKLDATTILLYNKFVMKISDLQKWVRLLLRARFTAIPIQTSGLIAPEFDFYSKTYHGLAEIRELAAEATKYVSERKQNNGESGKVR